jgi:hypothetical protein
MLLAWQGLARKYLGGAGGSRPGGLGGGGASGEFHHQSADPVMVTLRLEGTVIPVMSPRSWQMPEVLVAGGVVDTHAAQALVNWHSEQQSCQVRTVKGGPAIGGPV